MKTRFTLFLTLLAALSFSAQAQMPAQPTVPTTKVLAIAHRGTATDSRPIEQVMPTEVRDTVKLYLSGKLDQWYFRQDGQGVVFILNATSVEDARAILANLPMVKSNRLVFDFIPLGPLRPLNYLLTEPAK